LLPASRIDWGMTLWLKVVHEKLHCCKPKSWRLAETGFRQIRQFNSLRQALQKERK
jgi:hypothetical protein